MIDLKKWLPIFWPYIFVIFLFGFLYYQEIAQPLYYEDFPRGWFYQYQTLIAGGFAIFAAWLTVTQMRKNQEDIIYSNNLKARAYMHDTAKELCDYCDELFEKGHNNLFGGDKIKAIEMRTEDSPDKSINYLKDHIGYLDKKSAQAISALLSQYQVLHSRSKSRHKDEHKKLAAQIVEIAEFNVRVLRIFDYARAVEKDDFEEKFAKISINYEKIYREDVEEQLYRLERYIYGYGVAISSNIINDKEIEYVLKYNYKSRI